MKIYLNAADGRKDRQLNQLKISIPPGRLLNLVTNQMRTLLRLPKKDQLLVAQNSTTHLLKILNYVPSSTVYICSHEISYFADAIRTGLLPSQYTTRGNYTRQLRVAGKKHRAIVFEPANLLASLRQTITTPVPIIILSHVSRLNGQILITSLLYRQIKREWPRSIVIVDGAQAVGAISVSPQQLSDMYIAVTSKFIGAEPHLAFAWIRATLFPELESSAWSINPVRSYKELYSTYQAIKHLRPISSIAKVCRVAEGELRRQHIPFWKLPHQVASLLFIPVEKRRINYVIKILHREGVIVSSNVGWSIVEPEVPCIRVSISSQTSVSEVLHFTHLLSDCIEHQLNFPR